MIANERFSPRIQILRTSLGEQMVVLTLEDYAQLAMFAARFLTPETLDAMATMLDELASARRAQALSPASADTRPAPGFREADVDSPEPGSLAELREDARDIADAEAVLVRIERGEEETISSEEMHALLDAPTPLAFWRKKRGLTQKALAAQVELPQAYLSELETGKKKGSTDTMKRIARALRLSLDDLVL